MKKKHKEQLYHGIDATNFSRKEYTDEALAHRLLSPSQLREYTQLDVSEQPRFLAKHWCIREALFKAYNFTCPLNSIEMVWNEQHQLVCYIDGIEFIISISYCDEIVFASVLGHTIHH